MASGVLVGAPGRIRTCDHPLRRRMLYPTELRALTGRGREIRTPDILLPKQARYQTALYPVNYGHHTGPVGAYYPYFTDAVNIKKSRFITGYNSCQIVTKGRVSVLSFRTGIVRNSSGRDSHLSGHIRTVRHSCKRECRKSPEKNGTTKDTKTTKEKKIGTETRRREKKLFLCVSVTLWLKLS